MPDLAVLAAVGLVLAFALGLTRVLAGPTTGDRLLSLLLTGSTGVAFLLVMGAGDAHPGWIDTALALAVLTPVTTAALLVTLGRGGADESRGRHHVD